MQCPICGTGSTTEHLISIGMKAYRCLRCGDWVLFDNQGPNPPHSLDEVLGDWEPASVIRRSRLSHIVRRSQRPGDKPVAVQVHIIPSWNLDQPLPSPAEQLDRLLLWIADHQPSYAERAKIPPGEIEAWVGALISRNNPSPGLSWLLPAAEAKGLVTKALDSMGLTLDGWARVEEIRRHGSTSKEAFLAMQFDDPEVEAFVGEVFYPAVTRAGFTLSTLAQQQPAGLIDDQLRVRLRNARFVVADLTRGNRGAYWEAGFAEGLGRPVIYTCRKAEWLDADKSKTPHFDTNHHLTLIWEADAPGDAAEKLTATIRATLPEEAKLTDE